ncbi:phage shock protein PspA [Bowmanella denitrificans]|uniref:phage shock protein PspA n=1 Tax=Bowmanella denitrificans TaxID=366582 RepID=UPI000C9A4CBA|nr:phage shock protein PspA [Bowmanella denitrificans]
MGVFSRMNDIVQANLNALLDKAEDPKKVIRLIVQEMEETLVELRAIAARNLAAKKELQRKINRLNQQISEWQSKAELALTKEREDLAKLALSEKHKLEQQIAGLDAEMQQAEDALQQLQQDSARLQEKLSEARTKQKALMMREESVAARLKVKVSNDSQKVEQVMQRFDHYEYRVEQLEAQLEAYDITAAQNGLHAQFAELEADEKMQAELEELKQKVQKKVA